MKLQRLLLLDDPFDMTLHLGKFFFIFYLLYSIKKAFIVTACMLEGRCDHLVLVLSICESVTLFNLTKVWTCRGCKSLNILVGVARAGLSYQRLLLVANTVELI